MKILVTGGAGFIGSHVVDKYVSLGNQVAVIDNLSTGFKKNLNSRAQFYEEDIKDLSAMEKIFFEVQPDIVNHHAALAEVAKSLRDPTSTLEINVMGTVNVLAASGKSGVKKFIFSSTGGAIYGDPKENPVNEEVSPEPLSPYGLSKLLGEECIKFYAKTYKFDYLIFRYPNIYGQRQNPKGEAGIVAIFADLMKSKKQPTIFGDGTKTRDYVCVEDIVNANELALTNGKQQILNLGWGKEVSDKEMFDEIASALNFKEEPIYAPFRKGEVNSISLDATEAQRALGWKPKISLKDGIQQAVIKTD